jgi:hypothetical protein
VHTPHIGRRARIWPRLWAGGGYGGCDLWLHCRIRADVHFRHPDQSTGMASPCRWWISLLSGRQDLPGQTSRASGLGRSEWSRWCLCLNVFPDAHKSDDHSLFCGHICRVGGGKRKCELCLCGGIGLGCFYRLSPMVAYLERWCRPVSGKVQPSRVAVGQQNFGCHHHRVWFACPPEPERMRAQRMRQQATRNNRRVPL